jgi:predicted CxxxxCH...CXXCH cytochrome family protein
VLKAPDDCSICHGAAPADGNHPVAGQKHGAYFGTGTGSCLKCHPDHPSEAKPFAHATSAGNRALGVQFTTFPNQGGSYSRDLTYPNYLPSKAGLRNGICLGLYCHSPGNKNSGFDAPNQAAIWGNFLSCTGCHKANYASGDAMASGSHGKHVNGLLSAYACSKCHSATATANDSMTIADVTKHVNGQVNVSFGSSTTEVNSSYNGTLSKTPGSAYGACSNVYCHSNAQNNGGVGITYSTPVWGNSTTGKCGSCHADGTGHNDGSAEMSTGSHKKHLSYTLLVSSSSVRCAICHNVGGATFTPWAGCSQMSCHSTGGAIKHADQEVNVSVVGYFGGTYDGTPAPGDGYGACANVYCHSNGQATPSYAPSVTWGAGTLSCNACHGSATSKGGSDTTTPLSGKHASHVNNPTVLGAGKSLHCIECHSITVSSDTTIASTSVHINKMINYTGLHAGGPRRYNSATKVCSNLYCHSSGQAKPVFRNMTGTKSWASTATLSCNGCHGYGPGAFAPVAGEPNYISGSIGSGTENSHQKHTVGANMQDSRGCAKCHRLTADKAAAGKLRDYSSAHLNSSRDVSFAVLGNFSGHYSSATKTCSNTYCHSGSTIQWGTRGPLACNSCHKADATLAGAHNKHWQSVGSYPTSYTGKPGNSGDAGNYRFECASCHGGSHANGPAATENGAAAEVFFSYSGAVRLGSYSYGATRVLDGTLSWSNGSCSATYCHSNGNGGDPNIDASGFNWASGNVLGCFGCHGTADTLSTNAHARHVGGPATGKGISCPTCHAATAASNGSIADKTKHVNGEKDVDFSGVAQGTRIDASTICSTSYCHSNGKGIYSAPDWNSSATGACGTCHATAPGLGSPLIATGAHFSHFSTSVAAYGPMLSQQNATGCQTCHNFSNDLGTNHINRSVDLNGSLGYNSNGTGTCTPCHTTQVNWTAGAVACESCHTGTLSVINDVTAPDKSQAATRGHGALALAKGCTDCHERNARHINGGTRLQAQLTGGLNTECKYCHDDSSVVATASFRNMSTHFLTKGGSQAMACAQCHDPHGTTNLHMINTVINGKPIVFNGLNDLVDTATNQGFCQVCHTQTAHYRAGVPENGHPTSGCLSCHRHSGAGGAFQAPR